MMKKRSTKMHLDDPLRLTDTGNSEQFARDHSENAQFVPEWGAWTVWDGSGRWSRDAVRHVNRMAVRTVKQMTRDVLQQHERADKILVPFERVLPRMKGLMSKRTVGTLTRAEAKELNAFEKKYEPARDGLASAKRCLAWAKRSASAERLTAMLKRAGHEESVETSQASFDCEEWLFNAKNGTIDLRTGKLRTHRQADLI